MPGERERREAANRLLYYDALFSALLQGYEKGIIIEKALEEVADILAWERGFAELEIDEFIEEVKTVRELNRKYLEMELESS
jgi:hypothetical protein